MPADPAAIGIVRATQEQGHFALANCVAIRKDGTNFWLGLHLMPVRGSTPQHFVVLGRDITESLQARQQQAAIQGLLAKVFRVRQAHRWPSFRTLG